MVGDSMFNGIMAIKGSIKLTLKMYQLVLAIYLGRSKLFVEKQPKLDPSFTKVPTALKIAFIK